MPERTNCTPARTVALTAVAAALTLAAASTAVRAARATAESTAGWLPEPGSLTLAQQPESIYAPPEPPRVEDGVNEGAVHLDLTFRYMTDYVYRGIDYSEVAGSEDSANVQVDAKLSFDLGRLPHPYLGVFVNYYDSDPISRFQEIRPNFGFDWLIKPFTVSAGYNSYIYPDRDEDSTAEGYGQFAVDDSFLWSMQKPILSPYVYAAYDFDLYNGWYFEAGVKHTFTFEDTGLAVTALADVAYVVGLQQYLVSGTDATGFQHYDLGMIVDYSLNNLLNISRRYGEFTLQGYLFYTDNLDSSLRADTQVWGGAGIRFRY